jgi:NTE family protein
VGHCIAHVGVLKALHRAGISIHSVAGTSGGALVAGLFCAERNVADLEEAVRRIGWKRLAGLTLFASRGLATSEPIARFVSRMIAPRTRFSEMALPLAVTATDLLTGETVIFRDDACPVPEAVRISCTIPLVYAPVVRGGRLLVDGGVSDPLPVDAAQSLGPDVVVAVSLKHRRSFATFSRSGSRCWTSPPPHSPRWPGTMPISPLRWTWALWTSGT